MEYEIDYESTSLWKKVFDLNIENSKQVKILLDSYLDARQKIVSVLDKIGKDFPNLTIHDISHVDSLWNIADTIIGKDYHINPLEGYMLGISFLIHDSVLSYDAFGGVDHLRNTKEWKDEFALNNFDKNKEKECDFKVIRLLHAEKSKDILDTKFERNDGTSFYIIQDETLRKHLSKQIGKISSSHHWSVNEVREGLGNQVNPIAEFPNEWTINPRKIACILRCSDAAHIDNGRAPDYLLSLLNLNGVSLDHWISQNHLSQICENKDDKEYLLITSSYPFNRNEFAAWNVAYDAINVANKEIVECNKLLKPYGLQFAHKGITGANSREELARYVETDKWAPVDACVHSRDIAGLIEKLGGYQLYGKEEPMLIVFRELIQNARDAIVARQILENNDIYVGRINIDIKKEGNENWVEISDNGLGMSLYCIKNYLLNFGTSYWMSDLSKLENVGLLSGGYNPIGKFGIGFYSVFMVSDYVSVETRRYSEGKDKTYRIEFPNGLTLTPIFSNSLSNNQCTSTIVRFKLKKGVKDIFTEKYEYEIKRNLSGSKNFFVPFGKAISALVAGLDVDVYYKNPNMKNYELIHENIKSKNFDKKRWLSDITFSKEQKIDIEGDFEKLEFLKDKYQNIFGLASLSLSTSQQQNFKSLKTVNGLANSINSREGVLFYGYLDFETDVSNRNSLIVSEKLKLIRKEWAEQQYEKYYRNLDFDKRYVLQASLFYFGVDPIEIATVCCYNKQRGFVYQGVEEMLEDVDKFRYVIPVGVFDSTCIDCYFDFIRTTPQVDVKDMIVLNICGPGEFCSFFKIEPNIEKSNDATLCGCIKRIAKHKNINLHFELIQNYHYSTMVSFKPGNAWIIKK